MPPYDLHDYERCRSSRAAYLHPRGSISSKVCSPHREKQQFMSRVLWLFNRVAAAVIGALVVGCLAAVISTAVDALTCGPVCSKIVGDVHGSRCITYESSCVAVTELWAPLIVALFWTCSGSLILGTLPGIAALTLTPARTRPWKSLPVLIAATMVGFGIWLAIANGLHMTYGSTEVAMLFVIPTVTGLLAAINIERLPMRIA